jgi:phosphinothricin acetyltransferase
MIREATKADAEAIAAIYAPLVTDTVVSFEEEPPSAAEIAKRIAASHLCLVAEEAGDVVGYAYAARFHSRAAYRWSTEASIYLAPEARGRGIGKKLVTELLDRLRQMGFVNVFGGATVPNPASERLLESFGFKKIAHQEHVGFKFDAWHDVSWRQLTLREPTVPPPELRASPGER